jgi:signal transduction histidine kinase
MEIRKKLTLQFIGLVAIILLISSTAIYMSFSKSRKEEFYDRLTSKAKLVAQMIIDIDEIDTELLRKIEKNNPLSLPNEKIEIFDYKNQLIYSTNQQNDLNYTMETLNKIRLDGEERFTQHNREIIGYFYTGQYDRIVVFVGAEDIFGIKKLMRLRIILIFVFIGSLIIVFFAGRIFAIQLLNPISKLVMELDDIEATNLSVRVNEGNGTDEISQLSQTFNKMLTRLESAFNMQKNFIANASHELRTPLTVMSGQIEVMLLKDRKTDDYKETLKTIWDEIKNLTNISNRLLLLAQTSSDLQQINFNNCRIDEILWQCRQDILKRHPQYKVDIELDINIDGDDKLTVYGSEPLLKTAFLNIIDNACKYSNPNAVAIIITNTNTPEVEINFRDKGIGIPEDELKNIYEPFYRAKNVLAIKGHGIGLSLVEKITTLHRGTIVVKSNTSEGSVFRIILPLNISIEK